MNLLRGLGKVIIGSLLAVSFVGTALMLVLAYILMAMSMIPIFAILISIAVSLLIHYIIYALTT